MGLAEGIYLSATIHTEVERRVALFENVVLTGGVCVIKGTIKNRYRIATIFTHNMSFLGLRDRIESEMTPFLAASETSNEHQPKEIKWRSLPEYFTAYKERHADVSFLGACIVARVSEWWDVRG